MTNTIIIRNGNPKIGKSSLTGQGQLVITSVKLRPGTKIVYSIEIKEGKKPLLKIENKKKKISKVGHDNLGQIVISSFKLIPGTLVNYSIEINEIESDKEE